MVSKEIDHNEFRDKNTEGQMLHVEGPGDDGMAQRAWIHHNYFHDFANSGRNNSSALHIGHSARSMTPAHAAVEHNLFERTEGENEGGAGGREEIAEEFHEGWMVMWQG